MSLLKTSLPLLLMAGLTGGQLMLDGDCPNPPPILKDFNLTLFMGKWFEYARYPSLFKPEVKCKSEEYTLDVAGQRLFRIRIQVEELSGAGRVITSRAVANRVGGLPNTTASYRIRYPNYGTPKRPNFNVLFTDYHSHAIAWNCINGTRYVSTNPVITSRISFQDLFIMIRKKFIDKKDDLKRRIDNGLEVFRLDETKLVLTNQTNCQD